MVTIIARLTVVVYIYKYIQYTIFICIFIYYTHLLYTFIIYIYYCIWILYIVYYIFIIIYLYIFANPLKNSCIPEINPTWLWCIIPLMHYWIWFAIIFVEDFRVYINQGYWPVIWPFLCHLCLNLVSRWWWPLSVEKSAGSLMGSSLIIKVLCFSCCL